MADQIHRCAICESEFKSEKEYCDHLCKVTGFQASTPEHLDILSDGRFSMQSKTAIDRGSGEEKK